MRILGIHGMDNYGVGGALRGQEMGYALRSLGHKILQSPPGIAIETKLYGPDRPEAMILTGTWHQLSSGRSNAVHIAEACEAQGLPCIWWYGSNGSVYGCVDADPAKRKASQERVVKLICERPFIAVICPYSMGIYERHGVPRDKMRLVPSVFDGALFTPEQSPNDAHLSERLRYKFSIPDDAFCMGTVGHTPNSKGGDDVLQGMAVLKDEMPDLHYIILHTPETGLSNVKARSPDGKTIGNSEWDVLKKTRTLAQKLGLADRVHFLGTRFPRVSMPTFYRLLSIYCSPSKAENLGQPLVESQLCGLPLVTYKGFSFDFVSCPETAQQIDPHGTVTDDYGLVIPETTGEDVAAAIRGARDMAETKGMAAATREWAYAKFHHHNAQIMVDAIEECRGFMKVWAPQEEVGDQGQAMTAGYISAAERIEKTIGTPAGLVLDVGCNTGAGMETLRDRWPDARVFGIEVLARFAGEARAKGLHVEVCPAERMVFRDNHFNLVFSRHSLEHMTDRAAAIRQMMRVCKPGGHIYVQAPIEPEGSPNEAHMSPFRTHDELRDAFLGMEEVYWGPQEEVAEVIVRKPLPSVEMRTLQKEAA